MLRRTLMTVSAAGTLALSAAAPAIACDQPPSPTSAPSPQATSVIRAQAYRHHHHYRHHRGDHDSQAMTADQSQWRQDSGNTAARD